MKGRVLSYLCSLVSVPCLLYYVGKYWHKGELNFTRNDFGIYTLITGVLLVAIFRLFVVESRLKKMETLLEEIKIGVNQVKDTINEVQDTTDFYHDQNVKLHKNTRSFISAVKDFED
ncbi:MAG: hypothetical protein ACRDDY_19475 [Clostridium sp.]|uniref:hypothetical protein n=1 Tax=Clostridium sp. TaxID=1506 RepID=UPI003EE48746